MAEAVARIHEERGKGQGRLGGTDIMVFLVGLHLLFTTFALKTVVTHIGIAETYFCLKIPMTAKHPGIAIGKAATGKPSLEAGIGKAGKMGAEELEIYIDVADIELSAMTVYAKEMAGKTVAEPIAH